MGTRVIAARLLRGAGMGAVVCGAAVAVLVPSAAWAADSLVVVPTSVEPGGRVVVTGQCPEPVGGAQYVRATVAVDALGRYQVVPVTAGEFRAKITIAGVGTAADPEPGTSLRLTASCRTEAAFVADVGRQKIRVVDVGEADLSANAAAADAAVDVPSSGSASAAKAAGGSDPDPAIPARVPLIALGVAVVGSLAAFVHSRRSERRSVAMTGHPAQRGVGREPPRVRK